MADLIPAAADAVDSSAGFLPDCNVAVGCQRVSQ